jgi:hypothetical protein
MYQLLLIALSCHLAGCALMVPVALVNTGLVAADERMIGERSVPVGSRGASVGEGHTYFGLVALSPDRSMLVVPYNSVRAGEGRRSESFFGIGLRLFGSSYRERASLFISPGEWQLVLPDGTILRPVGHRISQGPGISPCVPGYRPQYLPPLDSLLESRELQIHGGGSGCLELYFDISPPDPSTSFRLNPGSIREGQLVLTPTEIAFQSHYGR